MKLHNSISPSDSDYHSLFYQTKNLFCSNDVKPKISSPTNHHSLIIKHLLHWKQRTNGVQKESIVLHKKCVFRAASFKIRYIYYIVKCFQPIWDYYPVFISKIAIKMPCNFLNSSFIIICFRSLNYNIPLSYCSFHLVVFSLMAVIHVFVQVHWTYNPCGFIISDSSGLSSNSSHKNLFTEN